MFLALYCAALQAEVRAAHEGSIWATAWHPAGHLLATGAGDYAVKFWCRWVVGSLKFLLNWGQGMGLLAG